MYLNRHHNEVSFIMKAIAGQKIDHLLHRKIINLLCALTSFIQNKKGKEEKQKRENPAFPRSITQTWSIERILLCSDSFFWLSATSISNNRILLQKIAHYASMFHYPQEYVNLSWKPIM